MESKYMRSKRYVRIAAVTLVVSTALAVFPAKGEDEPSPASAQDILRLAPESAALSLAFPPMNDLMKKIHLLAGLFSDPGTEPADGAARILMQWLRDSGLSEQKTLSDMLQTYGLDPGAPFGLFLDPSPVALHARKVTELAESGTAWWQALPAGANRKHTNNWFHSDFINAVAVIGCIDPALALSRLENLLEIVLGGEPLREEIVENFTIRIHADGMACGVAGKLLFVGNHVPMLREALERISKPASVRYGAPECPAKAPGPVVCATRLDRLYNLQPELSEYLRRIAVAEKKPSGLNNVLHNPIAASMGSDPCISTLDVTEKGIEFAAWLDLSAHTRYAAIIGNAKPARLGAFMPEECQAFLCLQLTENVRDLLRQRWIPFHAEDIHDPIGFFRSFHFLNGETALGIVGGNGSPRVFALAEVSEFDSLKAMIEKTQSSAPWIEDPNVPGARFADYPPYFFLGRLGNVAIAATERESCRRLAQALASNQKTAILEMHASSIEPDMPLFGLLSLETDDLDSILPFVAKWVGAESPESFGPLGSTIARLFREIQLGKVFQGNWQKVFAELSLR